MTSLWDFLKRNRGKIVVGGLSFGAVFALRYVFSRMVEEPEMESNIQNADRLALQARREYVYDTNQRSCDSSLEELVILIKKKLEKKFDVNSHIEELRVGNLRNEERLSLWMKVEVISFARLIAFAYSISLLTLSLKCQISILASQICSSNEQSLTTAWWCRFAPVIFKGVEGPKQQNSETIAIAQKIFLKLIHYYLEDGLLNLFGKVQEICQRELEKISLNCIVDALKLESILSAVKKTLENANKTKFSGFIIPKLSNQKLEGENSELSLLLNHLTTILETRKFHQVLSVLVDYYLQTIAKFVVEKANGKSMPMAKLLPLVADSFYALTQTGNTSPFHISLCSAELHQFSKDVFLNVML